MSLTEQMKSMEMEGNLGMFTTDTYTHYIYWDWKILANLQNMG